MARTRILSFRTDGIDIQRFGILDAAGTGVIELGRRTGLRSLGHMLAEGRLGNTELFLDDPADYGIDDIVFDRPLIRPGKIFCIGVNYGGRNAEYNDSSDASYPSVFVRFPESFTGHGRNLTRPPESDQLDYEGEIVVVIGTAGRRIPIDRARDHIAAVSLGNEGTIRDWVRHAKFNVTQGKNWRHSGSIGPWLVPINEIPEFDDLTIETRVNGQVRQHDSPRTMKYPIEYQIHYLSTFCTLEPGDVIFTGTPTGAGARHDPPVWLVPGDTVEVEVAEIGVLRNGIEDEVLPEGSP
jgi:2-keto-4-pentenoate hydratase/2-oxohepta-3-ene-1,7-dioic acid hydratase in catechol pathway